MSELKPCVTVSNSVLGGLYIDGEVSDADRANIAAQVPAAEVDRVVRDANAGAARCRAQFDDLVANGLGAGLKAPTPANIRSVMSASGDDRASELLRVRGTWGGLNVDAPAIGRDLTRLIDTPQLDDTVANLMRGPGYYRQATLTEHHRAEVADAFTDGLSDAQLARVSYSVLKQMSQEASPAQKARLDQEIASRLNVATASADPGYSVQTQISTDPAAQLATFRQIVRYNATLNISRYSVQPYTQRLSLDALVSLGADDLKRAIAQAVAPSERARLEASWIEATGG
jgi:hypothetical protein